MADPSTAPDAAEREALSASFRSITASTADAAVFFLESHGWNLDAAIESFFDADEEPEDAPPAAAAPPVAAVPRPNAPPPAAASKKPSGSGGGGGGSGRPVIRTLADLNRGGGSDSEDDEDEPTEYYAGGEKSGMLVQDPSKGNRDVDSLFEQARQMGATAGPPLDHHSSSSSRSFTGTGRLLSGDSVTPAPAAPQQSDNVAYTISFWTNGFTIDDGPLRRFDDPENASFLESIAKSECPRELAPTDRRTGVSVNLVRKNEKYQEPKRSTAFQGVGRTLGGDGSASSSAAVQPTAAPSTATDSSIGLSVNPSLPSTSVQLRLADGTRMVARFNTSHTVGHIRAFIDASRPGASRTYQLQTVGFPPKQLADQTQTIEQAGLANSVIVQRL